MAKLINGKEISQQIKDELKEKVSALKAQGKNICLAVHSGRKRSGIFCICWK